MAVDIFFFMIKSPRKNVPDVGIELGTAWKLCGHASNLPSYCAPSHEQTKSNRVCCFQILDAVFQKNPLWRSQQLSLCRVAALKSFPVHRYSFAIFTCSGPFGLQSSTFFGGSRYALKPGLGGVRDVASAIISHEQTQSNRVCVFKLRMLFFQKISFQFICLMFDIGLKLYAVPSPCPHAVSDLELVFRALILALRSAVAHIHIQVVRPAWKTSTHQWNRFSGEIAFVFK